MQLWKNSGSPSTQSLAPRRSALLVDTPYLRRGFSVSAPTAVDISEKPSVTLDEWWLARVKGHEQKIAVAGFFERNNATWEFTAAPISKRYEPCALETEDGVLVFIYGFFNTQRSLCNGYSSEACEKFSTGFPHWWEEWNMRYPKAMSFQIGSEPSSSTTSNSHEDSNVLLACMVECTIDETPVASLHAKAASDEATDKQSSEKGKKPVGSSRKQRSAPRKLQHASRSPNINRLNSNGNLSPLTRQMSKSFTASTPESLKLKETGSGHVVVPALDQGCQNIAYARGNLSPLTRQMSKSFTTSTPESLKLKETGSGRVVVPALDQGCQNIAYARDGSISAIIGLDSPSPLKGSTSKYYERKRKRTN